MRRHPLSVTSTAIAAVRVRTVVVFILSSNQCASLIGGISKRVPRRKGEKNSRKREFCREFEGIVY
jgi:hypothetical protein